MGSLLSSRPWWTPLLLLLLAACTQSGASDSDDVAAKRAALFADAPMCSGASLSDTSCVGGYRFELETKTWLNQHASCGDSTTCRTQTCKVETTKPKPTVFRMGRMPTSRPNRSGPRRREPSPFDYEVQYEWAMRTCQARAKSLGRTYRDVAPGIGGWECHMTHPETVSVPGTGASCDASSGVTDKVCTSYVPKSCWSAPTTSAAQWASYKSESALRAAYDKTVTNSTTTSVKTATCVSCADMPLASDGSNASALFGCLESRKSYGPADVQADSQQRMQMLYELHGERLSAAQRASAQASYDQLAPAFALCAEDEARSCTTDQAHLRQLNECGRLAAPHASKPLAAARFDTCLSALGAVSSSTCETYEAEVVRARETASALLHKSMAWVATQPTSSVDERRDATALRAYFVGSWWQAARHLALYEADGDSHLDTTLDAALAEIWARATPPDALNYLRTIAADNATTTAELEVALAEVIEAGTGSRFVLQALSSAPSAVRLPLNTAPEDRTTMVEGEPLLLLGADALREHLDNAEALTQAHDLACLIADCRAQGTITELTKFYEAMANMATSSGGRTAGPNAGGWLLDLLTALQSDSVGEAMRAALSESEAATVGRSKMMNIIALAKLRRDNYESLGLLRGEQARVLSDAVDHAGAERIKLDVEADARLFAQAVGKYRDGFKQFLREVTAEVNSGVQLDVARARAAALTANYDDLDERIRALQVAASREDLRFADLAEELRKVEDVLDQSFVAEVGQAAEFNISGAPAAASFDSADNRAVIAQKLAVWQGEVRSGEMVQVLASGEYAPTCLLADTQVIDDHDGLNRGMGIFGSLPPTRALEVSGTETCGPEGYQLTRNGSEYKATGVNYARTDSLRVYGGVRASACGGLKVFGTGASACGYGGVELARSATASSTYSDGVQSQTTVNLKDGLRDARAPFPEAPVGALLLVTADRDQIIDVDVASRQGLSATVALPEGVDQAQAYLVVNDLPCTTEAGAPSLRIEVRRLQTEAAAARATVDAVASVRTWLRHRASHFLAQGMFLPAERASEQAAAALQLTQALARVGLEREAVPAELSDLVAAVISHEITRIDRLVEISRLERERNLLAGSLHTLGEEVRAATSVNRLNRLLPNYTLKDLSVELLSLRLRQLGDTLGRRFIPVLEIWYPEFLEQQRGMDSRTPDAGDADAMRALLEALAPEKSLSDVALDIDRAISERFLPSFARATRRNPLHNEYTYVAVSVPNPKHDAFRRGRAFESHLGYPTVNRVQAERIWNAIDRGERSSLEITPELVYTNKTVNDSGYLDCGNVTPVMRKLMLTAVIPGNVSGATNNSNLRTTKVSWHKDSLFATDDGLVRYALDDDSWANLEIFTFDAQLTAGDDVTIPLDTIRRRVDPAYGKSPGRDIGTSLFSTVEIDFNGWNKRGWLWGDGFGDTYWYASELVVVMAVDTQSSRERDGIDWLPQCPGFRGPVGE